MRQKNREKIDYNMQHDAEQQKKIQKFHTDLATLEVPQPCTTCQEALPGILVPQSQECTM